MITRPFELMSRKRAYSDSPFHLHVESVTQMVAAHAPKHQVSRTI